MKKVLLIISHLGSGSDSLCQILNQNPRLQFHKTNLTYNHPETLDILTANKHKCDTTAATWVDQILHNQHFTCKALYKMCKFVYLVRDARCISESQTNYYCYRLRRICEMAKQTPGAILTTWEEFQSGRCFPLLEKYLNLKEPLKKESIISSGSLSPGLSSAQKAYERYLYFLRNGCKLEWDKHLSS